MPVTLPDIPRTPNRKGEGGRLQADLLDAGLRLIDSEGLGAVSLRAIARAAGVSAPSIYLHFANLDAFLSAVVGQCFEQLIKAITSESRANTNPDENLLASCRGYLSYAHQFPNRYALLFGQVAAPVGTAGTLGHDFSGGSQRAFTLLIDAVTACHQLPHPHPNNTFEIATTIWVGLDGFANLRVQRPHFPWPQVDTLLRHLVLVHIGSDGNTNTTVTS
jgi:AcrR family transcriptional regulator